MLAIRNRAIYALGIVLLLAMAWGGEGIATATPSSTGASQVSLLNRSPQSVTSGVGSPDHWMGPTKSVKPPTGLKVAAVACGAALHGCESPITGLAQAAKALGWHLTKYDGKDEPDTENAAMLDALSNGAQVIVNIAIDPQLVQEGLAAAKKAGVPVVSGSDMGSSPNPPLKLGRGEINYAFDISPDYGAMGVAEAQWVITASGSKGHVAVFGDKEFGSVNLMQAGLGPKLKKCSSCTVYSTQYFTSAQLDQLPQITTGFLESHPDVNYVVAPFDPAAAEMVEGIQEAGMAAKIRLISSIGAQQNLNFIRTGEVQAADVAFDNQYMGWAIADQISRLLTKQPLAQPIGENDPFALITKANLPPKGTDWTASYNYRADFLKLWGKG